MYIRSTDDKIEAVKLWTENKSLEESTMLGMVEGRQGRGRPFICWMDEVMAATKLCLPGRIGTFGEM